MPSGKRLSLVEITSLHRIGTSRLMACIFKVVHSMRVDCEGLSGNMFRMDVLTSAGTYVKELVHGDFDRTRPSLSTMLECDTDILALDVEEVFLDWPPGSHS